MTRLDDIKARAKVVATKPENREATYTEFGAVLRLACFDVPALVAALERVSLHVPTADTTGNVYCVIRGADSYQDCPMFEPGDEWSDHIADVVARALEPPDEPPEDPRDYLPAPTGHREGERVNWASYCVQCGEPWPCETVEGE